MLLIDDGNSNESVIFNIIDTMVATWEESPILVTTTIISGMIDNLLWIIDASTNIPFLE